MSDHKHTVDLHIGALSYGPYGIGRHRNKVVFVPLTAPQETVAARIVCEKRNHSIGELVAVLHPSPHRRPTPCRYAGTCGGCSWQHIQYTDQLRHKQAIVAETLSRIGGLTKLEILPIIAPSDEFGYRRRIRLHSNADACLGFHRAMSRELVAVEACMIAAPELNHHIEKAREWVGAMATKIRTVELVTGDGVDETIFNAHSQGRFQPRDKGICQRLGSDCQGPSGVLVSGHGWRRTWGATKISIQIEAGLTLEMEADLFSQVNPSGNRLVLRELLEWGEFSTQDLVLELYSGAGNLTLPIARRAGQVVAIERDPRLAANGQDAAVSNGILNVSWVCGNAGAQIARLGAEPRRFTKIVLNPPRSGAKEVLESLSRFQPLKIFYLSCNPATLARDLRSLATHGYRVTRVRPFDLFPQTYHVEALAELVPRRRSARTGSRP